MDPILFIVVLALAAKYGVTDAAYAVRGKPNPRAEAAKARYAAQAAKAQAQGGKSSKRRPSRSGGAFRRYLGQVWEDAWTDALTKHARKREARQSQPARPDKPRGAARVFFSGLTYDLRRKVARSWEQAWVRADEKRRTKSTRLPQDNDVVEGSVVPNATGPDPDSTDPATESDLTPGQDSTVTPRCRRCREQDADQADLFCPACRLADQAAVRQLEEAWLQAPIQRRGPCPNCGTTRLLCPDGENYGLCATCLHDQRLRPKDTPTAPQQPAPSDQHPSQTSDPTGPTPTPGTTAPTHEGNTTMSNTTVEITGLDSAIQHCAGTADNAETAAVAIEGAIAGLQAGGTEGDAISALADAQDHFSAAASALRKAEAELTRHLAVRDAYDATGRDAGTKDFVLAE